MMEKCQTCGREMNNEPDSLNLNCGGDCMKCMADCGDPDCIVEVEKIAARERDTGSSNTSA